MPELPKPLAEAAAKIPGPVGEQFQPARSLNGLVVVVTGGSAGIGRATAALLVEREATVIIGSRNAEACAKAASEIGAAAGRRLDVADPPGFTTFLDEVERDFGPLGVLINNAGIMPLGRLVDEDDATTARILAINLHGVIHGTREAIRRMTPRGSGHIVNVSSTLGKAGLPGGATYAATKFGIVGFCESVKGEIENSGLNLTIVMPGVVETSLGEGVKAPIGIRLAQPEDVAEAIVDALVKPRYEVYVPFEAGPIAMLGAALPQGMRDTVAKAMGLNRTLTEADAEARATYEEKVRTEE